MRLGIVGLPNVGKSTLFNSITKAGAASANYPFCTIDPNVGVVAVPDERLDFLNDMYNSEKLTPAVIEFVDIAGLVKGASEGLGLGNKFLSHIREMDAIVHVVRCFEDENVIHVDNSVDPIRDIETINLELILADMDVVTRRHSKEEKTAKNDKQAKRNVEILEIILNSLNSQECVRDIDFENHNMSAEDFEFVKSLSLLTYKPVLYAANVGEEDLADFGKNNPHVQRVMELAKKEGNSAFVVCAKIEEELASLPEEEKLEYLKEIGCEKSGLELVIQAGYELLGLISFLTAGPKETRAWTIKKGSTAPQAAGKIHSDFERGFIRAEIVAYDDLFRLKNYQSAKEAGLVRSEGKEYIMKDGDVVLFRFNV